MSAHELPVSGDTRFSPLPGVAADWVINGRRERRDGCIPVFLRVPCMAVFLGLPGVAVVCVCVCVCVCEGKRERIQQ